MLLRNAGRPKPIVTWWKDGKILDSVIDTVSIGSPRKFTANHLFIDKVTRSLWGTKLVCKAQSAPMATPIVREVPLDIYRKCSVIVGLSSVIDVTIPVAQKRTYPTTRLKKKRAANAACS